MGETGSEARPKRVQLKRTKGWRKPEGAVVVARPSEWGNPFAVACSGKQRWTVYDDRSGRSLATFATKREAREWAVLRYRFLVRGIGARVSPLRGRDLACWCPLDAPCHADVLLELANP